MSGASYFSSVAGDVRTSSALLSTLAPGEFITSLPVTAEKQHSSKNNQKMSSAVFCCLSKMDFSFPLN